jgi:hypothetical protein
VLGLLSSAPRYGSFYALPNTLEGLIVKTA